VDKVDIDKFLGAMEGLRAEDGGGRKLLRRGWQGYFGSDYQFDVEIGLYELGTYIRAHKVYEKLKAEQNDVFEALYDSASPSITGIDYDVGRMFIGGTHTEVIALKIIDAKEAYLLKMGKEKRKANMFKRAMSTLSDEEQKTILIRYQGERDESKGSANIFFQTLYVAEDKLIQHLSSERKKQMTQRRLELSEVNKWQRESFISG
jgi:hypothetical protein